MSTVVQEGKVEGVVKSKTPVEDAIREKVRFSRGLAWNRNRGRLVLHRSGGRIEFALEAILYHPPPARNSGVPNLLNQFRSQRNF